MYNLLMFVFKCIVLLFGIAGIIFMLLLIGALILGAIKEFKRYRS